MINFFKFYYRQLVLNIYKFRNPNPDLSTPNGRDHFSASLSIVTLIVGVIAGIYNGWEYNGFLGVLILTPIIGLVGLIIGAILGILLTAWIYIAIWLVVIFGLILILVMVGDGFSVMWESAEQMIGL